MKYPLFPALAILVAAFAGMPGPARADMSLGMQFSNQGLDGFYLNISNYYRVPHDRVLFCRDQRIPDEEIPVVFYLAARAHVGPEIIISQRLSGLSWMNIMLHYKLSPAILYVPVAGRPGPPYGNAYGYYRKYPRHQWNKIRLPDADFVNLVNLRFLSEHHGYSAEEVMKFRGEGRRFYDVPGRGKGQGANQGKKGGDGWRHGGKKEKGQKGKK